MSQFFVSCKESRIENNRSFYGCFHLGPFEPSQSITIANTLRRTLLSEIYGLAIVSVEIEGATHEYSSLPGVYESVLDILLNLKEIVLKKTIKNFSPQIGYLRVRGPGVVLASHLRLPPFIQCVDPDQYIANLSHNGFLNMKFVIQYGNKWLSPINPFPICYDTVDTKQVKTSLEKEQNNTLLSVGSFNVDDSLQQQAQKNLKDVKIKRSVNCPDNIFNFHFKKRRLFIKKLKVFGVSRANSYIDMFSKNLKKLFKYKKKCDLILKENNKKSLHLILKVNQQYPGINLKIGSIPSNSLFFKVKSQTIKKSLKTSKLNPLFSNNKITQTLLFESNGTDKQEQNIKKNVDFLKRKNIILDQSVKNIQILENCWKQKSASNYTETKLSEKAKLIDLSTKNINSKLKTSNSIVTKRKVFFNVNSLNIDAIFNPILKVNYIIEINDFKISQNKIQNAFQSSELYETLLTIPNSTNETKDFKKETTSNPYELQNILKLNQEISALTKETLKHNIIFEIWTNGSMHPRDALYQAFKNLIKIFLKLNKVQPFGVNKLFLKNLPKTFYKGEKAEPYNNLDKQTTNAYESEGVSSLNQYPFKKPVSKKKITKSHVSNRTNNLKQTKNTQKASNKTMDNLNHKHQDKEINNNVLEQQSVFGEHNTFTKETLKVNRFLLKKVKKGELKSTFIETVQPLNETSFLSTYISPKVKKYYFNKKNLFLLLNSSIGKNFVSPIFITGKLIPEVFTTFE